MKKLDLLLNEIGSIESSYTKNNFNHLLYYELYPDLKNLKLYSYLQLYNHYLTIGQAQGRIANYTDFYDKFPSFDYNVYITANKPILHALKIKYARPLDEINDEFKQHFAIVHYFLVGRHKDLQINSHSQLANPNPDGLLNKLSFLKEPSAGNIGLSLIQNYTSNNFTISSEFDLQDTDIGSILVVDNVFPLQVKYSQKIKELNDIIYIDTANITTTNITGDLNIYGNLNISNIVLANVDVFQNFNTQFMYNNSYIYTENTTFVGDTLLENLETHGNLVIDGGVFSQRNFSSFTYRIFGNVVCSGNILQMSPSSQIKILQHFHNVSENYSLSFYLSLSDLTAESQSLFTTNNSSLNITTINNIELIINDQILAGSTMLSLNTFYKICLIFNNGTYSIYVNENVDSVGILDVIDFGHFTIGNNILLPIEIQNFIIKENNNNNTLFEMKIENNEVFFYGNQISLNLGTNLEVSVPTIFNNDVNTNDIFTNNIYVADTAYLSNLSISYLNIGNNFIVNESNVNFLNDITMNGNLYVTGNSFLQNIKFDGNIICDNNGNGSVQLGVDNENNSLIYLSGNTSTIKFNENEINYSNNIISVGNILYISENVSIGSSVANYPLDVSVVSNFSGNVIANNIHIKSLSCESVKSNLYVDGTISNNSGFLYGPTLLLQWEYNDIPVGGVYSFGYSEPGNNTGFTGSQFNNGISIQNYEIENTTARLIIRCQDISPLYNGPIGPKLANLTVSQIRYQGGKSVILACANVASTFVNISETFTCTVDTFKGYCTVVSPWFKLDSLDVPSIGINILDMTNKGTYMRIGPTYIQYK